LTRITLNALIITNYINEYEETCKKRRADHAGVLGPGKAFIKEVIPHLPDPKPHYNSVATIVKILEEKGFLDHEAVGNVYSYFPKDLKRGIPEA
jgi:hypothetical protein